MVGKRWQKWAGTSALVGASLALALASGCGSSSTDTPGSVDSTQVSRYQELAGNIDSADQDYGDAMGSSQMGSMADCQRVHQDYEARVRPWVHDMLDRADAMDGFMGSHGGADVSDMRCTAEAMMDELDHHAQAACASNDVDADRAEAQRHRNAMHDYAGHVQDRCDEMMGAFHHDASWGPMMNGCGMTDGSGDGHHHWMMGDDDTGQHHGMM